MDIFFEIADPYGMDDQVLLTAETADRAAAMLREATRSGDATKVVEAALIAAGLFESAPERKSCAQCH